MKTGNRRYYIGNLYVIQFCIKNIHESFLCCKNPYDNKYIEMFTNTVLDTSSDCDIFPLCQYYPLLSRIHLDGSFSQTAAQLFSKYKDISYVDALLDYDYHNVQYRNVLEDMNNDRCGKKYKTLDIYIINNGYNDLHIGTYNKLLNRYTNVFTGQKITVNDIEKARLLNNYLSNSPERLDKFTLLRIQNELIRLNVLFGLSPDEVISELKDRGLYSKSQIYLNDNLLADNHSKFSKKLKK